MVENTMLLSGISCVKVGLLEGGSIRSRSFVYAPIKTRLWRNFIPQCQLIRLQTPLAYIVPDPKKDRFRFVWYNITAATCITASNYKNDGFEGLSPSSLCTLTVPSKRNVSTSSLISMSVSPRPSSSLASSRMSRKSGYLFFDCSGFSFFNARQDNLV